MRVDRRTFLKRGAVAGGLLAGAGLGIKALAEADGDKPRQSAGGRADRAQEPASRQPQHPRHRRRSAALPAVVLGDPDGHGRCLPTFGGCSEGAVSFGHHYTASNDCSPARATMLTGLYTHQTGCMITGGSTLDPGFPTWGTMLREHGYHTRWLGKWHLTHHDNHWTPALGEEALERYGFAGGVYPSPDGGPGQGWHRDPEIAGHFRRVVSAKTAAPSRGARPSPSSTPTTSPGGTCGATASPPRPSARRTVRRLPPNFETPELLIERNKPRLQRSLQDTAAASFGPVPFAGPEVVPIWLAFLDLYAKLQREVDRHIGTVLQTLHSRPEVAANTVVVFTSDHGEYGASHGLRGKGAGAYEEAIRVPLIVKDLRGKLAAAPQTVRKQLSSSVDVAPLLLTLATGSNDWRSEAHYSHIADRLDLAAILADPEAPGREYVLHATDETVTEFAIEPYAATAPAARRRDAHARSEVRALLALARRRGIEPLTEGQEAELYDYTTQSGRLELHNSAEHTPLEASMREQLEKAFVHELREPLPERLQAAHGRGFADYFSTARTAAAKATIRRKEKVESTVGDVAQGQGGPAPHEQRRLQNRRAGEAPRTAPVALSAWTLSQLPPAGARASAIAVSKPDRGAAANGASDAAEDPASTRQEATPVAPFQLA